MDLAQDILKYFARNHADFLHAHGSLSTTLLIETIDCKPNESILEIGFGTGATIVELAHRFSETDFFGLERSKFMYEIALKRLKACNLKRQVTLCLVEDGSAPFVENQFDAIYLESILAIQDESSLRRLLLSIRTWLKPGGKLICNETIWLPHVSINRIEEINAKCRQHFGIIQANGDFPYQKDWAQLFESYQLKVIKSNVIANANIGTPIKQKKQSKRFTQRGKIRSIFNPKLRIEFGAYRRAMNEIMPSGDQLLEGWFFLMINEK